MKGFSIVVSSLVIAGAIQVGAQNYYPTAAPPPAPSGQVFAGAQLDQLLGPIALYPDPLIAQILSAATQPSQIAVAANYVNSGGDPNQIDAQPWDTSVKAVAHVPQVLQLLDGNLQWTAELGQAFANQPTDVMNSVQRLRAEAMQQGNLQNNQYDTVENDNGEIEIVPTNPDTIYVPQYDPGLVYYQPGVSFGWGLGFGIGPWLDFDFDWGHHHIVEWDRDHPRPGDWWHERPEQRRAFIGRAPEWRPEEHRGGGGASRQFFSSVNRGGDRGYEAPRETRPAFSAPAPREGRPSFTPRESVPAPRETRPTFAAPAPRPAMPARPSAPSMFGGGNPSETRAASSRGMESRGVSHPAVGGGGGGGRGGNQRK
ncbi:MAG TPA: DUF3300 domain-containing protein [Verrucomicrobiae bacterium]|nr:DUF3300 domain-containing protein [Verrucomicrobiae bacterium]